MASAGCPTLSTVRAARPRSASSAAASSSALRWSPTGARRVDRPAAPGRCHRHDADHRHVVVRVLRGGVLEREPRVRGAVIGDQHLAHATLPVDRARRRCSPAARRPAVGAHHGFSCGPQGSIGGPIIDATLRPHDSEAPDHRRPRRVHDRTRAARPRRGGAAPSRRLLARRELPVGRPDLPARQPAAARAAARRSTSSRGCSATWGTTPGLNLLYAHLNRAIVRARPRRDLHHRARATAGPGWSRTPTSRAPTARSTRTSRATRTGLRALFRQFSFPGGIPSHVAPGDARVDPRGRRARLRPVPRVRRGLRQPRPAGRLRRRRRRGGDGAAGGELALATSSSTR